ncbi:PIN domain-containing protein [Candidatus Micrarchaeota archaeon]|nr:PIN domain-containing protein [Candidatus Micrarchaeota archaeon]
MRVMDSSLLIAFFHEHDALHARAVEDMKKFESQKETFIINEHVLGETITVLLYRSGLDKANKFIHYALENYQLQTSDTKDFGHILKTFQNQKHQISYIDATIVYLAKLFKCPVATYDENILKELEIK